MPVPTSPPLAEHPNGAPGAPRVNILLVDDRRENLVALESVLEDLGQNLVTAHSGREALKRLLEDDFAVILLDVQMPDMDGFETATLIRARERSRRTPIVFLTAINKDELHVARGYSVGAVDYLFKPFVPEVLKAKVAAFVELSKKTRELEEEIENRRRAEEEVRHLSQDLERRVTERTAELRETNRELQVEIGERKRAEEEVTRLLAEVREAAQRKDEFLAMLAHELRTPLSAIANADYVLDEIGSPDPRVARLRAIISRQTLHLSRLVDDLLDISRITRGKIELRKETLDVRDVARRAADASGPMIQSRCHHFSLSLPPEPVWLQADPTRLEQVLSNLLNNAAKYTDAGGSIWLEVCQCDCVVIRVRDTGIGIAREMLPRVFDLFIQAERAADQSEGGLGIGLALVKNLVQMHGGTVEARSEGRGKGCEFIIRLPLLKGEGGKRKGSEPQRPTPNTQHPTPNTQHPKRVLIVEDNNDAAETLAEILELWHHEVRIAPNGLVALDLVPEYRPEVILLDIGLPGMTGYEVAARLRVREAAEAAAAGGAGPGRGRVLLVALTGFGQQGARQRSGEAGFDLHLTKPVNPQELQRLLAEHPGS